MPSVQASTVPSPAVGSVSAWILAARPKTLTAAVIPVIIGTALALALGGKATFQVWISLAALLSAVFIQIGTNFFNDAIDFENGADTAERLGPVRATQSGLLSKRQVKNGALLCFALALGLGLLLVLHGGLPILIIGLLSLWFGYAYTGGPFPLAYHGLGDLFVLIFFGLIAVSGVVFLQLGAWPPLSFLAGAQIGLLAVVLIAINNLRDIAGDAIAGKRTVAVRLGIIGSKIEIITLAFLPFLLGAGWWKAGFFGAALLPLLMLPLALRLAKGVWASNPSRDLNKFLAKSAALHAGFGLLLSIGLLC